MTDDVKTIRKALGLTQKALAEALSVTPMTIKRWESGVRVPADTYQAQLVTLLQRAQAAHRAAPPPAAPARALALPSVYLAPPAPSSGDREIIRLGEAVRRMGLQDDGHGKRSDRTIRNAIKAGRLKAWKAPGYRAAIAEWCFYADDFETWRLHHYNAHRDPRRK